jgi:cytidine deaminase
MNKNELFKQALAAREHSHSPYSQVKVGAAVLFDSGQIYAGTNIENASFGATVCAERVAIWKGLSELGAKKIKEIAVVTSDGWPPCGMCRQVIAEFATPGTLVHVGKTDEGILKTYKFTELMPEAFSRSHLKS